MAITLIVMEPGSAWPGHVRDTEDVVALAHGGEGLLARVEQRLDSLRRGGQQVRVAVLACNGAMDSVATQQRSEVANELLGAVTSAGVGRLVLSTRDSVSMPLRRELLSLVGALSQKIQGTTTTVSVRFGVERAEVVSGSRRLGRTLRHLESMADASPRRRPRSLPPTSARLDADLAGRLRGGYNIDCPSARLK
jgi:hypothetical protein